MTVFSQSQTEKDVNTVLKKKKRSSAKCRRWFIELSLQVAIFHLATAHIMVYGAHCTFKFEESYMTYLKV